MTRAVDGDPGDDTLATWEDLVVLAGGISLTAFAWQAAGERDAPPFVLLHGVASTSRSWDGVAGRLSAAGHPVFEVDFRGHGRSDRPDTGYDLATYASDVAAVIAGVGLRRPILVGHSLGAMVALEAVARDARLARGLALVEGGLVDANVQYASLEECLAKLRLPAVGGMPAARVEGYLRMTNPGWPPERVAAAMAAFDVLADGTVAWRLTPPRLESLGRSMWQQHAPRLWPEVRVPMLIVAAETGDAAWTAQKCEAAAVAERGASTVRVEWLAGDHAIHEAQPEALANHLLAAATELWD